MENKRMENKIKGMIKETIKTSFIPEAQANVTDADALGLILSKYLQWDGLAILKATYSALEDANFHTENVIIKQMINQLDREVA